MTDKVLADLVVVGANEVVTCDPSLGDGKLGRIEKGAVAVSGEQVVWVGRQSEFNSEVSTGPETYEIDASGRSVVPGFVDAHTHLVFAGSRRDEFSARARGEPYEAGGILDSARATRAATPKELLDLARQRATSMLEHGSTTIEAKSGYALDVAGEETLLKVLGELDESHPVDFELTFCGAHAVPEEFEDRADDYIELVCGPMLDACAPLAKWCDVFCDTGAFSPQQARRVLEAGKEAGLLPRIHANELGSTGGVGVAVAVQAASADHLLFLSQPEAEALAGAGVVGVVAPITALSLSRFPDVNVMREAGMIVAISSDLNSGMAPSANLQLALAVATRTMAVDADDGLLGITANAAKSLRRSDIGRISPGCLGDAVVLRGDSSADLGYHAGINLAEVVVKRGKVVAGTAE